MTDKRFSTQALVKQCRERMDGYRKILAGRTTITGGCAAECFERVCARFRQIATLYRTNAGSEEMITAIMQARTELIPLFSDVATVDNVIETIQLEVNISNQAGGPER